MARFQTAWLGFIAMLCVAGPAAAHPHVFVSGKTELVFESNGEFSAVRHAWTFDEMFSAFSAQGLDKKSDGKFSGDELAALAKENIEALKEFGYFTKTKISGKQIEFEDPKDYRFEVDEKNILTLRFTLLVKKPARNEEFSLEVYDPEYFVAFSFAGQDSVLLKGSSGRCSANVQKPAEAAEQSESFFDRLKAGADYGAQFSTRINIRCR